MKSIFLPALILFIPFISLAQQKAEVKDARTRIRYNLTDGDYEKAIAGYDQLLNVDSANTSEYLYLKGLCYYYLHNDSLSKDCFVKGLQTNPLYQGNNLGMGFQLATTAPDSSIQYSKKVVAWLKDSIYPLQHAEKDNSVLRRGMLSDAYHNIGMAFYTRNEKDSALYYVTKAMNTNSVSDDHLLASSYLYFKKNEFEQAARYAIKALDLNHYESRSALLMILAYEKTNQLSKAIKHLNECILFQSNSLTYWKRGGGSLKTDLMDSGKLKGYKHMQEISAEFHILLAFTYFKKNDRTKAAEAYTKAVELNHDAFYRISNEKDFMVFMEDYISYKLKTPLAPKNYLPLYNNLFSNTVINSR